MPRKTTSPWDFGELFPPSATRQVLSVSEITARIKGVLERQVGEVWVAGEITNLRAQNSGHVYFSLKDPGAQLGCVLFRGTSVAERASLRDGQRVVLQGDITVYEPRGQYQLIVRSVELQGVGALQIAFERLKQRLQAEGLFDPDRKRPIPRFPWRVGLVTSPTGAALQDIRHVVGRRFAGLEFVLAPCRVQGQGAEVEIAAAIRRLNELHAKSGEDGLDVILVTRGGGSLEDLWAFNEELVARAIAGSEVPVISAVGHEIDFTIADFVADLRAATPSAAAELLTAGYVEARDWVDRQALRLRRLSMLSLEREHERLRQVANRLARTHPRRRLNEQYQRLDDLQEALQQAVTRVWSDRTQALARLAARLVVGRPERRLAVERDRLDRLMSAFRSAAKERLGQQRERVDRLDLRLRLLSPLEVLARGYSITLDAATGRVLRRAEEARVGQRLRTRLHSGEVPSVVAPDGLPAGMGSAPGGI